MSVGISGSTCVTSFARIGRPIARQKLALVAPGAVDDDLGLIGIVGKVNEVRKPAGGMGLNVGLPPALLAAHVPKRTTTRPMARTGSCGHVSAQQSVVGCLTGLALLSNPVGPGGEGRFQRLRKSEAPPFRRA